MRSSLRPMATPLLRRAAASRYVCRQCVGATAANPAPAGRRGIQISSTPTTAFPKPDGGDAFGAPADGARDDADARFEVLGSPYSLLSVSLSASQNLYTRRGTLVSVAGKVENAQSTLAVLTPLRRAALGIPFLYQRISSTTPLTLLIGTKAATTTLFTLHLDGTTDWVVAQRNALLAWTGHTLAITPQRAAGSLGLGMAHWGTSFVTGRGLVALSAPGYIYPVTLAAGEELVVHPSHVVAYAVGKHAPQPFRLRSEAGGSPGSVAGAVGGAAKAATGAVSAAASTTAQVATKAVKGLHLQTPAVALPPAVSRFWHAMRGSETYKLAARALFALRTTLRRTIWGDRLFVHVRGPTTLLLSSRGVRVADVLTRDNVNEIADAEAGVVPAALERAAAAAEAGSASAAAPAPSVDASTTAIHVATVQPGGKVAFTDAKDLNEFVR